MIWLILFCLRKNQFKKYNLQEQLPTLKKQKGLTSIKECRRSECLEGLQNTYVHEQASHQEMRPLAEGGRRMCFIRLEETDCSWRGSWEQASWYTNPAEIAAQHVHSCAHSIAQAEGSLPHTKPVAFGSANKEERSMPRLGFSSTAFLEGLSFRWGNMRCLEKAIFKVPAIPRDRYHGCSLQLGQ